MVTHDVDEALLLADRIVMMTSGPARAPSARSSTCRSPARAGARRCSAHPDYFWLRDAVLAFLEARGACACLSAGDVAARTLCPYCGVGCGLLVEVEDGARHAREGRSRRIPPTSATSAPRPCTCRRRCAPPDRLLHPQVRARRDARARARAVGRWRCDTWPTASREIVAAHGPDAVAFYGSGPAPRPRSTTSPTSSRRASSAPTTSTRTRASAWPRRAAGYARSLGADGPPGALRRPRARRLLPADRHQHRRLPSRSLFQRIAAAQARRARRRQRDRRSIRAGRRPPTSPTCTCRCARAPTSRCSTRMLARAVARGPARPALHRRAHDAAGRRSRARARRLPAGARGARSPACRRETHRERGAPLRRARARRSRSGAWASTRAASAPTRTRRS